MVGQDAGQLSWRNGLLEVVVEPLFLRLALGPLYPGDGNP
jgi:anti-anti-sigma factor